MTGRASTILLLGFGTLIALIAVLGLSAYHRADRIESQIAAIHEDYQRSAIVLDQTKEDIYLSGIMIRDYLLDPSRAAASEYKKELLTARSALVRHLESLSRLISRDEGKAIERLRHEGDAYWNLLGPVFEWTPQQKSVLASSFLRKEVIPHRDAVLSIVRELDDLSVRTFRNAQQTIDLSRREFQAYLRKMLILSVVLAIGIALVSISRVSVLERRSENQRQRAERAESGLRRLSHQLVQAQEEERKSISRELHDEIGQMLTGLKMELANLEEFRNSTDGEFGKHLAEAKALTEQTMQSARNLAMGLRPSMLDDLGLEPALRWQAQEFSRHSGIPVSIETDGNLMGLSESVRTCIYRVVQESLTNCARHAEAGKVRITVHGSKDRVSLMIQDDGKGFDAQHSMGRGLGLIGMRERVTKLGGILEISSKNSANNKGTILTVELPTAMEIQL